MQNPPIAAISSPRGRGAISLIRLSGAGSLETAAKIFRPKNKTDFKSAVPGRMIFGSFVHNGDEIDHGMGVFFRAPNSYTGEDTVELTCHGGVFLTELILKTVIDAGATLAEAGEFTRRALLNGKISLTGAEAVAGLLGALCVAGAREASAQSCGSLAVKIEDLKSRLLRLLAEIYAETDYPDEGLSTMSDDEMRRALGDIAAEVKSLRDSYSYGRAIGEGIPAAIIGKANTGKSTLLNLLAGEELAIVTSEAGTTRDSIETKITLGDDLVLRLCDTAGIRESVDPVEQIGISRSREKSAAADLILAVFDSSAPFDDDDKEIFSMLKNLANEGKKIIVIANKSDAARDFSQFNDFENVVFISAKENSAENFPSAVKALAETIAKVLKTADYSGVCGSIITSARQYSALARAAESLEAAENSLAAGFGCAVAGTVVESALSALGECELTTVSADVVDEIFKNFCVGK